MTAARPTARPRHEARQVLPPRGRALRAVCRALEEEVLRLMGATEPIPESLDDVD